MDFEVDFVLSSAANGLLQRLNAKFGSEKLSGISSTWLELLNYDFGAPSDQFEMEVENNTFASKEDIIGLIKEALDKNSTLSETAFTGLSVNEVNKVLCAIRDYLDEIKFSAFCNLIGSWNSCALVEYSLKSVVLPKLQENTESSAYVIYSIKQLALSKPEFLCQNLIVPLLTDESTLFTDTELLSEVFSVLPEAQKDFIILNVSKKPEFQENDWQVLNPLIKYLSQNSLLILMSCILKFTTGFTKSQIFGRFLVTFCKHLELVGNKEALKEAVEKHETLLRVQALKYLELE